MCISPSRNHKGGRAGAETFGVKEIKRETVGMKKQNHPTDLTNMLKNIEQWKKNHPKATMYEIEQAVEQELDKLRQGLIEQLATEKKEEVAETKCPECGAKMMKNGTKKRRLKGKGNQEVELEREQLKCQKCGLTFFPPR